MCRGVNERDSWKENDVTMRWLWTVVAMGLFAFPVYAADSISEKVAKLNIPQEKLMEVNGHTF